MFADILERCDLPEPYAGGASHCDGKWSPVPASEVASDVPCAEVRADDERRFMEREMERERERERKVERARVWVWGGFDSQTVHDASKSGDKRKSSSSSSSSSSSKTPTVYRKKHVADISTGIISTGIGTGIISTGIGTGISTGIGTGISTGIGAGISTGIGTDTGTGISAPLSLGAPPPPSSPLSSSARPLSPRRTKDATWSRGDAVARYLAKRSRRNWTKKVQYGVRSNFAESRLRVRGRFVRRKENGEWET